MVNWTPVTLDDAAWDAAIAHCSDANAFQSSSWAKHKADFGWRPVRALAGPPTAPVSAVQALVKSLPGGVRVLWARGGPIGQAAYWNEDMRQALISAAPGAVTYGRLCSYRQQDETSLHLAHKGWVRPERPLDNNQTYLLNLAPEPELLKEGLSSNWRHNLKRGNARAIVNDWPSPDPAEMENIYREMEALKGLPHQHRANELESLCRRLGPNIIVKKAVVEGKTVALRACAVFGSSAIDLLAAATQEARKVYASYALLWALILEARRRGALTYDLGGADPSAARGVADFKSGVGAAAITTVGEWDFCSPNILRRPIGAMIAWKLGKSA